MLISSLYILKPAIVFRLLNHEFGYCLASHEQWEGMTASDVVSRFPRGASAGSWRICARVLTGKVTITILAAH